MNLDGYVGGSFALLTPKAREAIHLVARTEGILLDPIYTGRSMAALMDYIREGRIGRDKTVIFLHTGGTPGLFSYAGELVEAQL